MGLCFPLPCLRWLLIAVSAVMLGCGGLIVWLGRRLQKEEITDGADLEYYPLVIIAFGGWLIIVGFVGILSAWFRTHLGMALYILLVISTTCVLIALAAVGLTMAQNLKDALDEEGKCRGNDYLRHANDAVLLANEQICTGVCPCKVGVDTFGEATYANFTIGPAMRIQDCSPCNSLAPEMQPYKLQLGYCTNGGKASDFTDYYYSSTERAYFALIAMFERDYRCAGVCQDVPYYAFTDVNKGTPTKNCRIELQNWVEVYPLRYCAVIVAVGLVLFLTTIFDFCFVCHPYRKGMKGYDPAATNTQV